MLRIKVNYNWSFLNYPNAVYKNSKDGFSALAEI